MMLLFSIVNSDVNSIILPLNMNVLKRYMCQVFASKKGKKKITY